MPQEVLLTRWTSVLSHPQISPLEFYALVAERTAASEISKLKFSYFARREGGWFSARRIYLKISHGQLFFDLCAFRHADLLVLSYWLHRKKGGIIELLMEVPPARFIIERTIRTATYFDVDYIEFVQRTIHNSILEVVNELTVERDQVFLPAEADAKFADPGVFDD